GRARAAASLKENSRKENWCQTRFLKLVSDTIFRPLAFGMPNASAEKWCLTPISKIVSATNFLSQPARAAAAPRDSRPSAHTTGRPAPGARRESAGAAPSGSARAGSDDLDR